MWHGVHTRLRMDCIQGSAASETFQVTENMEIVWVLLQGGPSGHPGVLQVMGGCASPALLPTPPRSGWVDYHCSLAAGLFQTPAQDCQTRRFPGTPWAFGCHRDLNKAFKT